MWIKVTQSYGDPFTKDCINVHQTHLRDEEWGGEGDYALFTYVDHHGQTKELYSDTFPIRVEQIEKIEELDYNSAVLAGLTPMLRQSFRVLFGKKFIPLKDWKTTKTKYHQYEAQTRDLNTVRHDDVLREIALSVWDAILENINSWDKGQTYDETASFKIYNRNGIYAYNVSFNYETIEPGKLYNINISKITRQVREPVVSLPENDIAKVMSFINDKKVFEEAKTLQDVDKDNNPKPGAD